MKLYENSKYVALLLLQAAWNGSVSHDWGNRITRYRDTVTEESPVLINGAVNVLRTDNVKVNGYTSFTAETDTLVRLAVSKDSPGLEDHQSVSLQILHVLFSPTWILSACSRGSLARSLPKTCTIVFRAVYDCLSQYVGRDWLL